MSDNTIQSVVKIFSMLEILSDHEEGLSIKELSEKMTIHKSSVHRMASTLIHLGYLSQNPESLKYRINLKIISLGLKTLQSLDIVSIAKPYLKNLLAKTDQTITLGAIEHNQVVYVDKLLPKTSSFTINSHVGKSMPLYCAAVGKILLAHLSREKFEELWASYEFLQFTDSTIVEKEKMLSEIDKILEKGYAIDDEENQEGVMCIASPIFNYKGVVEHSVSISFPKVKFSYEKFDEHMQQVMQAGKDISKEIGYKYKDET